MKKYYKYIGIIIVFRHLYKAWLLFKLKTDTHIGFEYYWALKKYEDFKP